MSGCTWGVWNQAGNNTSGIGRARRSSPPTLRSLFANVTRHNERVLAPVSAARRLRSSEIMKM